MIIGFGTVKSGKASLVKLFNNQAGIEARLEPYPLPWEFDQIEYNKYRSGIPHNNVADICFSFINYIDRIINDFPGVKILYLHRDIDFTVKSIMKWFKKCNLLTDIKSQYNEGDCINTTGFPKYDLPKLEAVKEYVNEFHYRALMLCNKYPQIIMAKSFRIFNEIVQQEKLFKQLNIQNPKLVIGIHENRYAG